MKKPVLYRITVKHRKGCSALAAAQEGEWASPWALLVDAQPFVWATLSGNAESGIQGRHHVYLQYRCNDTQCPARVLIHNERVVGLAAHGTEEGRAPAGQRSPNEGTE